jgi:hypothetical protein
MTLEEHDGATTMKSRILYRSREARDAHFASGMKEGAAESFDRLEAHLARMAERYTSSSGSRAMR